MKLLHMSSMIPSDLNVPDEVAEKLNDGHKWYLLDLFGLTIVNNLLTMFMILL